MALKKYTNQEIKGGGGSKNGGKTTGGIGYTKTSTDRKTGKTTTKTGTLTPVSESEFKSNGKMLRKARLINKGKAVSTSGGIKATTKPSQTKRKIY